MSILGNCIFVHVSLTLLSTKQLLIRELMEANTKWNFLLGLKLILQAHKL
jgi:hypothetical protein